MTASRATPSLRAKVALIVFGVALALVLGEVVARLAHQDGYEEAIRRFADALVEADPELSHRLVPDARARIAGIDYRISSFGTRGEEPAEDDPSHRTLVLGDSVTMGWGVNESDAWPGRLEAAMRERTPGAEVVNAAVLGWGVSQYATRLEALAPLLSPDLVLVGYYPNDPGGTEAVTRRSAWSSELLRLLSARFSDGLGSQSATEYHHALHAEGSPGWQMVERSFSRLSALCRAGEYRCGVVLLPSLAEAPYPLVEEHRRLSALGHQEGLAVLDLAPRIADIEPASLWVASDDPHPDAAAHALYADAVAAWLEAEEL